MQYTVSIFVYFVRVPQMIATKTDHFRGVCTRSHYVSCTSLPRFGGQSVPTFICRWLRPVSMEWFRSPFPFHEHTLPLTDCGKMRQVVERLPVSFCPPEVQISTCLKIRFFILPISQSLIWEYLINLLSLSLTHQFNMYRPSALSYMTSAFSFS